MKIFGLGRLEWVSTTSYEPKYEYSNFGVDADLSNPDHRCTFSLFSNNLPGDFGHEGKWYKEKCEKTKGLNFICKIDESTFTPECESKYTAVDFGSDR